MKTIKRDITGIKTGVIIQQTNCQNAMRAGLARAIYEKWPIVKAKYHEFCDKYAVLYPKHADLMLLGEVQEITVQNDPKIIVINAFGQLDYGYSAHYGYNARFTDYAALRMAFRVISKNLANNEYLDENGDNLPIYIPRLIGAALGGGSEKIIHKLIEFYLSDAVLVDY
jgi:O-acetyl-ADP-ribose deacetylase (regulator of RNase III)